MFRQTAQDSFGMGALDGNAAEIGARSEVGHDRPNFKKLTNYIERRNKSDPTVWGDDGGEGIEPKATSSPGLGPKER